MQVIYALILYYSYTVIPTLNTFYFIFSNSFLSHSISRSVYTCRGLYLEGKSNDIKELQQNETEEGKDTDKSELELELE